jgi:hypothetical protein
MESEDSTWDKQPQQGTGEAGSSAFSKLSLNVNAAEFVPSFAVKSDPSPSSKSLFTCFALYLSWLAIHFIIDCTLGQTQSNIMLLFRISLREPIFTSTSDHVKYYVELRQIQKKPAPAT